MNIIRTIVLCGTALVAGCGGNWQKVEIAVPSSSVTLEVSRRSSHAILAEYERGLALVDGPNRLFAEVHKDTGGATRVNVYVQKLEGNRLGIRLQDRFGDQVFVADLSEKSMKQDYLLEVKGAYLGVVEEEPEEKNWIFVSAKERKEAVIEKK